MYLYRNEEKVLIYTAQQAKLYQESHPCAHQEGIEEAQR